MASTQTTTATQSAKFQLSGETSKESGDSLIEGLWVVPKFTDKHAERKWAKEHMAATFRVFAKFGYADGAGGHISLRDPVRRDCFWINPYSMHFGLIKTSDLILVSETGEPLTATPYKVNRAGFMIHAALHKAREDVGAAVHTHTPYGRAWSTFGKPIEMLNQDACYFYNDLSVYEGFGGAAFNKDEGENIAKALGPKNWSLIMQNHGLLTCGETVDEAAARFIALERCCQAQLLAEAAAANGLQKTYVGAEEAQYTKDKTGVPAVLYMQFKPEYDMILKESGGDFLE